MLNHLVRLLVLTVLVFMTISAYVLLPTSGDFWEASARKEVARAEGKTRFSIFLTDDAAARRARDAREAPEPLPAAPRPAESPAPPAPWDLSSRPVAPAPESDIDFTKTDIVPMSGTGDAVAPESPAERAAVGEGRGDPSARQRPVEARTYVVKSGDTLSEISSRVLGSVRFTKTIRSLNPGIPASGQLAVGQSLKLPEIAGEPAKTEKPVETASPPTEAPSKAAKGKTTGRKGKEQGRESKEPAAQKQPSLAAEKAPGRTSTAEASSPPSGKRQAPERNPRKDQATDRTGKPSPVPSPAASQALEITVKEGDTLYGLAARLLGEGARWPSIRNANRDRLGPGETLVTGSRVRVPGVSRSR